MNQTIILQSEEVLVIEADAPAGVLVTEIETVLLVEDTEVVLLEVIEQGPPGPQGLDGSAIAPINFAYGDANRIIIPASTNKIVLVVNINITTPFNGVGASLSIGTLASPALLVAPTQLDLSVATEFEIAPNMKLITPTDVYLSITPGAGATQGAGWIVISTATFN